MVTSNVRRERRQAERKARGAAQQAAEPSRPKPGPPPSAPPLQAAPAPSGPVPSPPPAPEPVTAPEPGPKEIDFTKFPPGILHSEDATPTKATRPIILSPEMVAHWQLLITRNPDFKIFAQTAEAAVRALMEEENQNVQEALAETQRTGEPVPPKVGPITAAVRVQVRRIRMEKGDRRRKNK